MRRRRRRDALRGSHPGRRVRHRPTKILAREPRRERRRARRRAATRRSERSSSRRRPPSTARHERRRSTRTTRPRRSTRTARRSSRSSVRSPVTAARTASVGPRSATSTRPARSAGSASATTRRRTSSRSSSRPRWAARRCASSGGTGPRPTARASATTSTSAIWRRAPRRARAPLQRRRVRRLQPRHRHRRDRCARSSSRSSARPDARFRSSMRPARRRSRRPRRVDRARRVLGWAPTLGLAGSSAPRSDIVRDDPWPARRSASSSPYYNEEEVIPELDEQLQEFLEKLGVDTEVVFVDDGSKDRSIEHAPAIVGARAALPRPLVLAQLRPPGGDHRGHRLRARQGRRRHGRRSPGSARGRPRDGRQVARGLRRRLRPRRCARGRDLLQALHGEDLLPPLRRDDPDRGAARHRRFPADEPARRRRAARAARDAPLRARPRVVGRLQADRRPLRPPRRASPARRSIRSRKMLRFAIDGITSFSDPAAALLDVPRHARSASLSVGVRDLGRRSRTSSSSRRCRAGRRRSCSSSFLASRAALDDRHPRRVRRPHLRAGEAAAALRRAASA